MSRILLGIDIGSTNVTIVVAQVEENDADFRIVGRCSLSSNGITKGIIDNIEKSSRCVHRAYDQIKEFIQEKEYMIFVNISGMQCRSLNSTGLETLKVHQEVTKRDVDRAINRAKGFFLPENQFILDCIPQYYNLDDNIKVKDPIGMTGIRLETTVHLITAAKSVAQNILKVLEPLSYNKKIEPIFGGLASANAVLTEEEKELGVAVVDIGGGVTEIAVFIEGSLRFTSVIPIGGNQISKDIAIGIKTSFEQAEKIKIDHGLCLEIDNIENVFIDVPGLGDEPQRSVSQKTLVEIIKPRIGEILMLVATDIERYKLLNSLNAGIVFTGGGSLVTGTIDFSKEVFRELPIRKGSSSRLNALELEDKNLSSSYSTAVGLLCSGFTRNRFYFTTKKSNYRFQKKGKDDSFFSSLWGWIKNLM